MTEIRHVTGAAFVVAEFRARENAEPHPLYVDRIVPIFLDARTKQAADAIAAGFPAAEKNVRLGLPRPAVRTGSSGCQAEAAGRERLQQHDCLAPWEKDSAPEPRRFRAPCARARRPACRHKRVRLLKHRLDLRLRCRALEDDIAARDIGSNGGEACCLAHACKLGHRQFSGAADIHGAHESDVGGHRKPSWAHFALGAKRRYLGPT
jgi:hypothetical protein